MEGDVAGERIRKEEIVAWRAVADRADPGEARERHAVEAVPWTGSSHFEPQPLPKVT